MNDKTSPHPPQHTFGGAWTKEKLTILRKYLEAYLKIFHRNPYARRYRTMYIDAFAGTGYRSPRPASSSGQALPLPPFLDDEETAQYFQGSAAIALSLDPGFYRYIFIEQNPNYAEQLHRLKAQHPQKTIEIHTGDANAILEKWLPQQNWDTHRAVMFLDPYGTQVNWALLEAIAKTKAIDLWLLFPLSVLRLLPKDHPPSAPLAQHLTRLLGTDEWRDAFYPETPQLPTQLPLFETQQDATPKRLARWQDVGAFFLRRLESIFYSVAPEPYLLTNSKNVPLFLLCFAAGNPRGSKPAVKIASDIIRKQKYAPSR